MITPLSSLYRCLCSAALALAALRLNNLIKKIFTVVVGDFLAALDVLDSADVNTVIVFIVLSLGVWLAGMVDVARGVLTALAVNDECIGDDEQVLPAATVGFVGRDAFTSVLDDELALFNVFGGE